MKILIVHHERPHFETLLALLDNLRERHAVSIWSDSLQVFERESLVKSIGAPQFSESEDYDACILVSGDSPPSKERAGPSLWSVLETRPVLRIAHRYERAEPKGSLCLFPSAQRRFIPASTGICRDVDPRARLSKPPLNFLIQGNIENRRNYDVLPKIAAQAPSSEFSVVGLRTRAEYPTAQNARIFANLTELDFHRKCSSSTFILPMIDPERYRGYFVDRFTSSIQIGLSYAIPFIAHRALFALYDIAGYAYTTESEFLACVAKAQMCSRADYERFVCDLLDARGRYLESNLRMINEGLANV